MNFIPLTILLLPSSLPGPNAISGEIGKMLAERPSFMVLDHSDWPLKERIIAFSHNGVSIGSLDVPCSIASLALSQDIKSGLAVSSLWRPPFLDVSLFKKHGATKALEMKGDYMIAQLGSNGTVLVGGTAKKIAILTSDGRNGRLSVKETYNYRKYGNLLLARQLPSGAVEIFCFKAFKAHKLFPKPGILSEEVLANGKEEVIHNYKRIMMGTSPQFSKGLTKMFWLIGGVLHTFNLLTGKETVGDLKHILDFWIKPGLAYMFTKSSVSSGGFHNPLLYTWKYDCPSCSPVRVTIRPTPFVMGTTLTPVSRSAFVGTCLYWAKNPKQYICLFKLSADGKNLTLIHRIAVKLGQAIFSRRDVYGNPLPPETKAQRYRRAISFAVNDFDLDIVPISKFGWDRLDTAKPTSITPNNTLGPDIIPQPKPDGPPKTRSGQGNNPIVMPVRRRSFIPIQVVYAPGAWCRALPAPLASSTY